MQHIDQSHLGGEDPFDGAVPAPLKQTVSVQRPLHCHQGDVSDSNSRDIQEGLHSLYKGLIPSLLSVGGAMAYFNIYENMKLWLKSNTVWHIFLASTFSKGTLPRT